jgi:uncharacterized protein YbgA (DUF1722 family)/uncharacterized protein YbbK (DUF523 family)
MKKPVIGISSCLVGHEVRHDGGHKHFRFATGELSQFFELRPFCPEVASGLGTPRPALRLNRHKGEIRVQQSQDASIDVTVQIRKSAKRACRSFDDLSGYILKKDSPSCGMERVRIYSSSGMPEKNGRGLFAQELMEAFPLLPVEEEGRLSDPFLRESFIERVYVYSSWKALLNKGLTPSSLMRFHARHKFSLLSRDEVIYRAMGPLIARASAGNLKAVADEYMANLMVALKKPANCKRHTNVLMHLMGYFKTVLSAEEKQEFVELLNEYRLGLIPLVVPVTMLKHYLRRTPDSYLVDQTYFDPYPKAMGLRNSI